jgi:hypothetical protein
METIVVVYLVYLLVSIAMTVWVARTLYVNGIPFLIDAFGGNEDLAASWNHLLVVGFYLVNFGFMALNLKVGGQHVGVESKRVRQGKVLHPRGTSLERDHP